MNQRCKVSGELTARSARYDAPREHWSEQHEQHADVEAVCSLTRAEHDAEEAPPPSNNDLEERALLPGGPMGPQFHHVPFSFQWESGIRLIEGPNPPPGVSAL